MFHRVDIVEDLPVKRFLALARRLGHYQGAMRHVAMAEAQAAQPEPEDTPAPTPPASQPGNDDAIAANVDLMAVHPVWGSVGSYTKAPLQDA